MKVASIPLGLKNVKTWYERRIIILSSLVVDRVRAGRTRVRISRPYESGTHAAVDDLRAYEVARVKVSK